MGASLLAKAGLAGSELGASLSLSQSLSLSLSLSLPCSLFSLSLSLSLFSFSLALSLFLSRSLSPRMLAQYSSSSSNVGTTSLPSLLSTMTGDACRSLTVSGFFCASGGRRTRRRRVRWLGGTTDVLRSLTVPRPVAGTRPRRQAVTVNAADAARAGQKSSSGLSRLREKANDNKNNNNKKKKNKNGTTKAERLPFRRRARVGWKSSSGQSQRREKASPPGRRARARPLRRRSSIWPSCEALASS